MGYPMKNGEFEVTECTFTGGEARFGGVVAFTRDVAHSVITFSENEVAECDALMWGGVIFIRRLVGQDNEVEIEGNSFTNNTAVKGPVLYVQYNEGHDVDLSDNHY